LTELAEFGIVKAMFYYGVKEKFFLLSIFFYRFWQNSVRAVYKNISFNKTCARYMHEKAKSVYIRNTLDLSVIYCGWKSENTDNF